MNFSVTIGTAGLAGTIGCVACCIVIGVAAWMFLR
jgi:hypothetical protein